MNILIVNTGRFGDVIQTTPLIKGLKKKYPKSKIYYLVLKNFEEAVKLIKEVDVILSIDFSQVLKEIDQNNINNGFILLKEYFRQLKKITFDLLINVSFSRLSACISSLLTAKDKRGLILSESNEFIATDNWSKFFLSIVDYREFCPFNLVDIFSKIGNVNSEKIDIEIKEKIKNVAFQMGASTFNRQWPVENFASLAKLLLKNNSSIKIYLFGSKKEEVIGKKFFSFFSHKNIINLIGKTTIKELYEILQNQIDLLITNDTGTMHLCWMAGKRVLELSIGPAYYITTAPYGENHIIIQPDIECCPCSYTTECLNLKCHKLINPEFVFDVIENNINYNNLNEKVKLIKTFYNDDKFLDYEILYQYKEIINKKTKKLWLDIIEEKIDFYDFYKNFSKKLELGVIISKIVEEIQKVLDKNIKDINLVIEKIEMQEKYLKNYIVSSYPGFVPFLKYFEYLKMDFPDDDFYKLMRMLKENYLKLFYMFAYYLKNM